MYETKPWLKHYGDVPRSIDFSQTSMYEVVMKTAAQRPEDTAYDFMGVTATYREFAAEIDTYANMLAALGLAKGDRITIAMPTSPPGIVAFYAANKLGAVSNMIHPLSTQGEVAFYINKSQSKMALTLDMFFEVFEPLLERTGLETLIIAKIQDYLPVHLKSLYWIKAGRKNPKVRETQNVKLLSRLLKRRFPAVDPPKMGPDDLAVILYSGGTTGTPKGVMLSNYNFVSSGQMVGHWAGLDPNYPRMLAMLPLFHGFGLGVCVNTILMSGGNCIMVPVFNPDQIAKLIQKKKPNYLVGPPTLFAALNRSSEFQKADLSCLRAAFSGSDTLPLQVKQQFDSIVERQGGHVKLLEGYGLAEAIGAVILTPFEGYRPGSIGVPLPEMAAKIVKFGTEEEAPIGEEGEICVSGPAVMLGYLDEPKETADTLRVHDDGKTWLHSGDVGTMDTDGYFYFRNREKRMIKSSGMNVYPSEVEALLYQHESVEEVCVIGVPDEHQGERVKAFVVLRDGAEATPAKGEELIAHCRQQMIKWSCPREVEFLDELPRTRVGKIAYRELVDSELAKLKSI